MQNVTVFSNTTKRGVAENCFLEQTTSSVSR